MATAVYLSDGTNTKPIVGSTTSSSFNSSNSASVTTTETPITQTAAGLSLGLYDSCMVYAELQGNTGGTLDVCLDVSPDGGTTWVEFCRFPQQSAGGAVNRYLVTFSRHAESGSIVVTGIGNSGVTLAANTKVGGDWGDRFRIKHVNGSGVTAGKAQLIKMRFNP